MANITINGVSVDPIAQHAQFSAFSLTTQDASGSDYILIQVSGPLTAPQRNELVNAGCNLLSFVPVDTYVAKYVATDLEPVRSLPFVIWASEYLRGFKIHPILSGLTPNADSLQLITAGPAIQKISGKPRSITIVLHKDAALQPAYDKVAQITGLDAHSLPIQGRRISLSVEASKLPALANIDAVAYIEPSPVHTLFNDVATKIVRADSVHHGFPGTQGLNGEEQIIGVCDTGFDKGSTIDVMPAFTGRVLKLYSLGRQTANDPAGHGTHVCGSLLGDQDVEGYGRITGCAPAAKLVMQSVLDAAGQLSGIPADLNNLFKIPYDECNVRVHSNSWGNSLSSSHSRYDSESEQVDEFVWQHRDMVICFAAGNDGIDSKSRGVIDAGSVSPPGTAKNCITVGASESQRADSPLYGSLRPSYFPVAPIFNDPSANNPEGLAAFSSRGNTEDGRIKPDIVAPGTSILSTLSRDAQLSLTFGSGPPIGYMYDSGTSMATPLVAGCAALVRQWLFRDRMIERPSAALVKALLINGASQLKGQYIPSEAGNIPDSDQGFGRIDIAATLDPNVLCFDEDQQLDQPGAFHELQVSAGSNGCLKITLVWTDPPGPTLQNDLDLIVLVDGQETHGNAGLGSSQFDRSNNVEQVFLTGLLKDSKATVRVQAFRIALEAQAYAMVVKSF